MKTLDRCTTCKKCARTCPFGIDTAEILGEFRHLVKESEFKKNEHEYVVKTSYPIGWVKKFIQTGNPFGIATKPLSIDKNIEFIFFPGCTAYYKDNELVARSKTIFDKLGLKYSTVDTCCYSPLKNLGFSKEEVSKLFNSSYSGEDKKIVTLCAGCYDSLKNDHRRDVIHISQVLLDHIDKLRLKNSSHVTYMDPCKLGRVNKIFDEPREVLKHIDSLKTFEANKNREEGLCCGGGGSLQYTSRKVSSAIAKNLLKQKAPETTLITSCSYCKYHLKQNSEEDIKHLVDIIFESMR
jgi:Fe-S oxidoreductase